MATLKIINNFTLDSDGILTLAKQGAAANLITDEQSLTTVTITGTCHYRKGTLATATANTIYDSSNDYPATFDYLFFWADVAMYLQLIGSATCSTQKVAALVPFVLAGYGIILGAANTTPITGGTEPVCTAVTKAVIGNYSGGSGNYVFGVID